MFTTLIVEDNSSVRQFLKDILRNRFSDMRVEEAAEGKAALEKIHNLLPGLIFMDIRLSGESGLDLTQKIKKDYPQAVIIILTSYDIPEYRQAAQACGADYFLCKGNASGQDILALVEGILPPERNNSDEPTKLLNYDEENQGGTGNEF